MKTLKFEEREDWLNARRGRITGTRLKDLIVKRGSGKKIGYYELIAEKIAIAPDNENPMDRGVRLEEEAIERHSKEVGKKIDTSLVLWTRDDNEQIALSPDGIITKKHAVEVKCLSSANHIKAYLTQEIPSEYADQTKQYFIVNDDLEMLDVVFYDPRIPSKDYFVITVHRKDVEEEVEFYKQYQYDIIKEINDIIIKLSF